MLWWTRSLFSCVFTGTIYDAHEDHEARVTLHRDWHQQAGWYTDRSRLLHRLKHPYHWFGTSRKLSKGSMAHGELASHIATSCSLMSPAQSGVSVPHLISSHTNLHPSQIHRLPLPTRPLYPRRQPRLRLLVVERPLRDNDQECDCGAAESEVKGFVDVLGDEAGEEGEDAGQSEQGGGEELGEGLAFEVLRDCVSGCMLYEVVGVEYYLAFPDVAGLVEEGIHLVQCSSIVDWRYEKLCTIRVTTCSLP